MKPLDEILNGTEETEEFLKEKIEKKNEGSLGILMNEKFSKMKKLKDK